MSGPPPSGKPQRRERNRNAGRGGGLVLVNTDSRARALADSGRGSSRPSAAILRRPQHLDPQHGQGLVALRPRSDAQGDVTCTQRRQCVGETPREHGLIGRRKD